MDVPRSKIQLRAKFQSCPDNVQDYFDYFPKLAEDFPAAYDVAIAYLFLRVETAHNMILYYGLVKLHRVPSDMAYKQLGKEYITRDNFKIYFENIFSKKLDVDLMGLIKSAEKTRDQIVHGKASIKSMPDQKKREAINFIFEYAKKFNAFASKNGIYEPFNHYQGAHGGPGQLRQGKHTGSLIIKGALFLPKRKN